MDVDRPLPSGSPVEVKIRVDASRGIVASAYIPLLDLTVEDVLRDKYRPAVDVLEVEVDLTAELERAREVGNTRPEDVQRLESDARDVEQQIAAARAGDRVGLGGQVGSGLGHGWLLGGIGPGLRSRRVVDRTPVCGRRGYPVATVHR